MIKEGKINPTKHRVFLRRPFTLKKNIIGAENISFRYEGKFPNSFSITKKYQIHFLKRVTPSCATRFRFIR